MALAKLGITTPLGPMTAAADGGALTGLWFEGQKHFPAGAPGWGDDPDDPVLAGLKAWLDGYFKGGRAPFPFRLAPAGPAFRQEVWRRLLEIPYGRTATYGGIAAGIAKARGVPRVSARAVGGAVARNPISILIPCHRVVGADGSLTGYAGGLDRKKALIALERGL